GYAEATSKAGTAVQAAWTPQSHPAGAQSAAAPTALDQGTELAAAAAPAGHPLVAPSIAMPSAAQLLAHAGAIATDTAPQHSLIGQVLFEALAGGGAHSPIDAVLNALPTAHAAPTAADQLAQLASFHATFGPDTSAHTAFALETIALHPDAHAAA
ncbi:MAG: hypothetical protein ABIW03_01005, partial [Sphingomicrobium sp.]